VKRLAALVTGVMMGGQAMAFDIQGHRGARGLMPENTLPSFAAALGIGVTTLELDTAITRDGVAVISHDPYITPKLARGADGRFLPGRGPLIRDLTLAEVKAYDVGRLNPADRTAQQFPDQKAIDGTRMPALSELFDLVERSGNRTVRFNIETKIFPPAPADTVDPETFARILVRAIRAGGMAERSTIQSFDWRTLAIVQRDAPEIVTVYLTTRQAGSDTVSPAGGKPSPWTAGHDLRDHGGSVARMIRAAGGTVWSPFSGDIDAGAVAEAHGLGLKVIPWTVNDEAGMRRMIDMGVDGLISDFPDRLRRVAAARGLPLPPATPVNP
jgi:glycerophosphoryl diester phosphodiesterase